MLIVIMTAWVEQFPILNVLRYISFRTGGSIMTALIISFLAGPAIIRWLKSKQKKGQPIREDGPQSHIVKKAGTPTMGGVLILLSISLSTLLWADLSNSYVWAALMVTIGFGLIGFADDYLKVTKSSAKGVPGRLRLLLGILISAASATWIMALSPEPLAGAVAIPFLKDVLLDFGWLFIPFAAFVMVGSANAVNLTDGLDGLATVPVIIAAVSFGLIAYLVGNAIFSDYLQLHFVPGSGDLAVLCGAIIGAGLGFLWFNAPPAMVFMGDTGSLALGGALGAIAVITKHELVLAVIGGLFVLETASVIIQVVSFKLTGRRVFRMAPIHHHFEQLGWAESTIVIRFWIIAVILALIGLSTLKLR